MKILCENTDEQHPLTINEIIEQLSEHGIKAFRTTVVSDIAVLEEFGIDVICNRSVQNQYFIGQRSFEFPELKLLIDAVGAFRFIPRKKSKELVDKLSELASRHQAKMLKKHICVDDRVKQTDVKVYYAVDLLHFAIEQNEEISFQYFDYTPDKKKVKKHNGYTYIFSPYSLLCNDDFYYILGYSEKHGKVVKFRVDRMINIKKTKKLAVPAPKDFDIGAYCKKVFSMYDEDMQTVELKCANYLMKSVIDRFGEDVQTRKHTSGCFVAIVEVSVSPTFFGWIFQFCGDIEILTPSEVKKQYCEKVQNI